MMHRGPAEEAVVVVKRAANEGMVTYLRIKRSVSAEKKSRRRRRVEYVNDRLESRRSNLHEVRQKRIGLFDCLRRIHQCKGEERPMK